MISKDDYKEAYVWIWLSGETKPVVAGVLQRDEDRLLFNYGKSYLARKNAISIYDPELPLRSGDIPLMDGLTMPGCIRDGSPDAWGRRVLINRKLSLKGDEAASHDLGELTYLLESGSDRAGALDFQTSATKYEARGMDQASLDDLLRSAEQVEKGVPLSPDLDKALQHGTSLGGARPKVLLTSDHAKYIAKFSMTGDIYNVVKAEFVAMRLASLAGLNVSPVRIEKALGKDVLLVDRFDRERVKSGWIRKAFVSALTMFEFDEMMARHASYETLAEIIRLRFQDPQGNLRQLFGRLTFNILCGNTDDHARNHAAFWDGKNLQLTPAYDICPQSRAGEEAGFCRNRGGLLFFALTTRCRGMRQALNPMVAKVLKRLHYPLDVILLCVRWYSAYPLSLRNLEEMMGERGISVDHSTVHRWAIKLLPVLEKAFRRSSVNTEEKRTKRTALGRSFPEPPMRSPPRDSWNCWCAPTRTVVTPMPRDGHGWQGL